MTDAQFVAIAVELQTLNAKMQQVIENTAPPSKFWRRVGMVASIVTIIMVLGMYEPVLYWIKWLGR
jgi:hypothetical protein